MKTYTGGRNGLLAAMLAGALSLGACASSASVEGDWGSDEPGQAQLTFQGDGSVSGTDGCNRLTGRWEEGEQGEGSAQLDHLAGTLMACTDVDTWLSRADAVTVREGSLHVFDAQGVEIGTLPRQ